jgi:AcrR family transcriptional regulator
VNPPHAAPVATAPRRRYDSPVRRERAEQTRECIIEAGAAILREHPIWNWDELTIRAAARRAGMSERTVYRHFANEAGLREAVMDRLESEVGVDLDRLRLEDVGEFTARVLDYVSSFPLAPRTTSDATLMAASRRLRDALSNAVRAANPRWDDRERTIAAAALDVLWSVGAYERLVADWHLEPADAIATVTWVIGLVERAIAGDDRPR